MPRACTGCLSGSLLPRHSGSHLQSLFEVPSPYAGEEPIFKVLQALILTVTGGLVVFPASSSSPAPHCSPEHWLGDQAADITICFLTLKGGKTSACELYSPQHMVEKTDSGKGSDLWPFIPMCVLLCCQKMIDLNKLLFLEFILVPYSHFLKMKTKILMSM